MTWGIAIIRKGSSTADSASNTTLVGRFAADRDLLRTVTMRCALIVPTAADTIVVEGWAQRRYAAVVRRTSTMARFIELLDLLRTHPLLGIAGAVAIVVAIVLLQRRPRLQRDADAQLAMLRRDNADRYTTQRRLR